MPMDIKNGAASYAWDYKGNDTAFLALANASSRTINVVICDGHAEFSNINNLWNYYWHASSIEFCRLGLLPYR